LGRLTKLQSLNLSECQQLSGDLSPLAPIAALQSLSLNGCLGIRRFGFAPLESLLSTLKVLTLYGCKLDDLPSEVRRKSAYQNVLNKVRAHFGERIDAPQKPIEPSQPLPTPPQVFVSYAWGNISPIASEEERQRQEVVEGLCRTLEMERCQVVPEKTAMLYRFLPVPI
jgi:hypothetical protein